MRCQPCNGRKGRCKGFKFICLAGVLVSLAGLGTATGLVAIKDGFIGGRIYSSFQYPNALASYLMATFFLSLYLWLRDDRYSLADMMGLNIKKLPALFGLSPQRYIYALSSFIMLVVFLGTKSNGGFLVFALALGAYLLLLPQSRRIPALLHFLLTGLPAVFSAIMFLKQVSANDYVRGWAWVLAGALTVIALQMMYNYLEKKGLYEFIQSKKYFFVSLLIVLVIAVVIASYNYLNTHIQSVAQLADQIRSRNAMERLYFYQDALKMVAERPLLGWGGGGWQEAYRSFQGYLYNSNQVHGHYFQIAVEAGITGVLVIAGIWFFFIKTAYRGLKKSGSPTESMLLCTVAIVALSLGIHAIIDFDLSLSALTLVLWSMFALMRGLVFPAANTPSPVKVKRPPGVAAAVSVGCIVLIALTGSLITASSSHQEAVARLKAGDVPGAIVQLEKAKGYNPFSPDFNLAIASLYIQQGKWEPAALEVEGAVKKGKYNAVSYNTLSGVYLSLGRWAEAVPLAEKAMALAPYQVVWHDNLARTCFIAGFNLMAGGKQAEARPILEKTSRANEGIEKLVEGLGPTEKELWNVAPMLASSGTTNLYSGAACSLLGDYTKAESLLKAVSGDNRLKAESFLWLGYVSQQRGEKGKTTEYLAQAKNIVADLDKQFPYIYNMINK